MTEKVPDCRIGSGNSSILKAVCCGASSLFGSSTLLGLWLLDLLWGY